MVVTKEPRPPGVVGDRGANGVDSGDLLLPHRREALPVVAIPPSALLPLAALTALTVLFGLFPETLLATVQQAAQGLSDPRAYIGSVFPGGN